MLRHCGNAVKRCLGACSVLQKNIARCIQHISFFIVQSEIEIGTNFLKTTLIWMVEVISFLHHTVLNIGKIKMNRKLWKVSSRNLKYSSVFIFKCCVV